MPLFALWPCLKSAYLRHQKYVSGNWESSSVLRIFSASRLPTWQPGHLVKGLGQEQPSAVSCHRRKNP
ncbi:hypothetical protein BDW68DRAFT_154659 [Aspergillus falconensis]